MRRAVKIDHDSEFAPYCYPRLLVMSAYAAILKFQRIIKLKLNRGLWLKHLHWDSAYLRQDTSPVPPFGESVWAADLIPLTTFRISE